MLQGDQCQWIADSPPTFTLVGRILQHTGMADTDTWTHFEWQTIPPSFSCIFNKSQSDRPAHESGETRLDTVWVLQTKLPRIPDTGYYCLDRSRHVTEKTPCRESMDQTTNPSCHLEYHLWRIQRKPSSVFPSCRWKGGTWLLVRLWVGDTKSKSCIQGKNVKRYYIRRNCWFLKVMLDFDLVSLYRSEAKRLKEPNKSNPDKNKRKRWFRLM